MRQPGLGRAGLRRVGNPIPSGVAPNTLKFLLQVADLVNAPNGQGLSTLTTGLLKSTTGTGVVSIGTPDTDYATPALVTAAVAALALLVPNKAAKFLLQQADGTMTNAQVLGALATGLLKNTTTTGVQSIAAAGVDYSVAPWKLSQTVRNGGAAQTLSIPVIDGENNGLLYAFGRLQSDGTDRSITIKINGSATNVKLQTHGGTNVTSAAAPDLVGSTRKSVVEFEILMHTSTRSGTLKRIGLWRDASADPSVPSVTISAGAFHFNDASTPITTVDIDSGSATGFSAAEAKVLEGLAG